ncbi:outer membrane beta-barrel protein [Pontibacter vulgaris]|uniref:outer membrane beta-barrel protein n=1 Tax=Pontibacter vulgaris TaxID=2905679 RepID=UPI001FA6B004|nr:outer membrane beta-barrel protein [Pontibacter vulgaris]
MKQLILLAGSLLTILHASAQIQPKSIFINSGFGLKMENSGTGNSKAFQISPSVNYLINERLSVGLFVAYGKESMNSEINRSVPYNGGYYSSTSASETKSRSLYAGPQVRYYQPVHEKIFLFAEARTGYAYQSKEASVSNSSYYNNGSIPPTGTANDYLNTKSSSAAIQANVAPGLAYFIKPRLGLELKVNVLNYTHGMDSSALQEGAEQPKSFEADFSLKNTNLGLSFFF